MHSDTASSHKHEHVFLGENHEANERRTQWVLVITALMMVGEIVAGTIFNSMALLADGFHMATHALAMGVAAAAYVYARKQARNDRYTFGTGKVGELAGFASALALGLISIGIAVESFHRLVNPQTVAFTQATIIAAVGLGVNIVSALMLSGGHQHGHSHGHGHSHDHEEEDHAGHDHAPHDHDAHSHGSHDNNFRSAYLHVIADALTSVLAIIALLAGRFLGWVWLDAVMGIVGAIVIANWSWSLIRDTSKILLDTADKKLAENIRQRIEADGDAHVTDLHVWQIGPGVHATIIALVAADPQTPEVYKARLDGLPVGHITIEPHRCHTGHELRAAA